MASCGHSDGFSCESVRSDPHENRRGVTSEEEPDLQDEEQGEEAKGLMDEAKPKRKREELGARDESDEVGSWRSGRDTEDAMVRFNFG